ncbi:MAG: hypothetical protein ACK5Q5_15550, partial [Planctomycetaceae bacterium]
RRSTWSRLTAVAPQEPPELPAPLTLQDRLSVRQRVEPSRTPGPVPSRRIPRPSEVRSRRL